MKAKTMQAILDRQANVILRDGSLHVVNTLESLGGRFVEYYIYSNEEISRVEEQIDRHLDACRQDGVTLVIGNAEHMSGHTMYRIWEALSKPDGYADGFHVILRVGEDAPIEHLDRVFRDLFAVLDPDGTFYREPEHA